MNADLFWAKVDKSGDCWPWAGSKSRSGYGTCGRGSAHRVAYELVVGPIPDGLELDHRCHTDDQSCPGGLACPHRACVNPDHLEPVTRAENGRRAARKPACGKGHEFTPENTYQFPGSTRSNRGRRCRRCMAEQQRARRSRIRAAGTYCPHRRSYATTVACPACLTERVTSS